MGTCNNIIQIIENEYLSFSHNSKFSNRHQFTKYLNDITYYLPKFAFGIDEQDANEIERAVSKISQLKFKQLDFQSKSRLEKLIKSVVYIYNRLLQFYKQQGLEFNKKLAKIVEN